MVPNIYHATQTHRLPLSACCPVLWLHFTTCFHFWSNFFWLFFFFNLPSLLPRQPALHHPLGLDGEAMETGQTHRQRRLGACGGLQRSPVDLYSASPPNSFFSLLLGRLVK